MNSVLLAVVALACPISMGVMMWFMGKGMRQGKERPEREAESAEGGSRGEFRP